MLFFVSLVPFEVGPRKGALSLSGWLLTQKLVLLHLGSLKLVTR